VEEEESTKPFVDSFVRRRVRKRLLIGIIFLAAAGLPAEDSRPSLPLPRISASIQIDGDLGDPGWQQAAQVTTFYESNVTDNGPPPVPTTVWLGYSEKFFYAAFRCDDPDISRLRAPFVDRDNVFSDQDFVGVILDARNDRRSSSSSTLAEFRTTSSSTMRLATRIPPPISSGTPRERSRRMGGRSRSAFPCPPCGMEKEIHRRGV